MKNLKSISTVSFAHCIINEFDAPNLNKITININNYTCESTTFIVGKKNFLDSPGII